MRTVVRLRIFSGPDIRRTKLKPPNKRRTRWATRWPLLYQLRKQDQLMKRERITIRVAPWKTMRAPTQRDADLLLERICDARTKASRDRIQRLKETRTQS